MITAHRTDNLPVLKTKVSENFLNNKRFLIIKILYMTTNFDFKVSKFTDRYWNRIIILGKYVNLYIYKKESIIKYTSIQ